MPTCKSTDGHHVQEHTGDTTVFVAAIMKVIRTMQETIEAISPLDGGLWSGEIPVTTWPNTDMHFYQSGTNSADCVVTFLAELEPKCVGLCLVDIWKVLFFLKFLKSLFNIQDNWQRKLYHLLRNTGLHAFPCQLINLISKIITSFHVCMMNWSFVIRIV